MKPALSFEAGGVRLRPLAADDLEVTLAWRNRDDARKWFKTAEVLLPAQHQLWFEKYQCREDDIVFIVEVEGKSVGQVAVYVIDREKSRAEVGRFLVAPEAAGKGYLFSACRLLLDLCRCELGLKSVYLEVFEANQRAIKIYRDLGFTPAGSANELVLMEKVLT